MSYIVFEREQPDDKGFIYRHKEFEKLTPAYGYYLKEPVHREIAKIVTVEVKEAK